MHTCKEELLEDLVGLKVDLKNIKCAKIHIREDNIYLPINFSQEDFNIFLNKLDKLEDWKFESRGIIWLKDSSCWLQRDYEELFDYYFWKHYNCPKIPEECQP